MDNSVFIYSILLTNHFYFYQVVSNIPRSVSFDNCSVDGIISEASKVRQHDFVILA